MSKYSDMTITESAAIITKSVCNIVEMSKNENFRNFMKNDLKNNNPGESSVVVNDKELYETTLRELIETQFTKKCGSKIAASKMSQELQCSQDSASFDRFSQPLAKRLREYHEAPQPMSSSQGSFMQSSQSSQFSSQGFPAISYVAKASGDKNKDIGDLPLKSFFDNDELTIFSQHFLDDSIESFDDDVDIHCLTKMPRYYEVKREKSNSQSRLSDLNYL